MLYCAQRAHARVYAASAQAADALKHNYLHQFHNEFVEREAPVQVQVCIPDEVRRSTNQYRERLYKEVRALPPLTTPPLGPF